MTIIRVAKLVPYFWYSLPLIRTFARTLYRFPIFWNHAPDFLFVKLAPPSGSFACPPPRIATSRPPGCNLCNALSRWLKPYWLLFRALWDFSVDAENGGLMTTTVG